MQITNPRSIQITKFRTDFFSSFILAVEILEFGYCLLFAYWDLGFEIWNLGFRIWDLKIFRRIKCRELAQKSGKNKLSTRR